MSSEEIKYYNRVWYLKTYEKLIKKALKRGLNKDKIPFYTEEHHILPKCQGGDDRRSNKVLLSAREHIIAHMLLSCMYPQHVGLAVSVTAMLIGESLDRKEAIARVSSRLAAKFREKAVKLKTGQKRTPEQRKRMSEAAKINGAKRKGTHLSEKTKQKMRESQLKRLEKESAEERKKYASNLGKKFSEEHKRKISEAQKNKPRSKATDKTKDKMSKSHFNRIKNNPGKYSKRVINSEGIIFSSQAEAARYYGVNKDTIKRWIDNHPEKGLKNI